MKMCGQIKSFPMNLQKVMASSARLGRSKGVKTKDLRPEFLYSLNSVHKLMNNEDVIYAYS